MVRWNRKDSEKPRGNQRCGGQVETDPGLVKGNKTTMALLEKGGRNGKDGSEERKKRRRSGS